MKKHLLTGIILLLPVVLTVWIIGFAVNFLTKPFMGIVSHFLQETHIANRGVLFLSPQQALMYSSQLIILTCLFFFILFLGMITRWYLFRWFIQIGERILQRLPFVNKIYKAAKDIVTHLFGQDKNSFKQVVLVPFPKEGIYTLGFLSQPVPKEFSELITHELISVFIPTTPNPTTGFTIMYRKESIIIIDMKPEDAIKFVVSCGMVTPPDQLPMENL
jgi:uncharacterized membrane protein